LLSSTFAYFLTAQSTHCNRFLSADCVYQTLVLLFNKFLDRRFEGSVIYRLPTATWKSVNYSRTKN